jgi:hypothetical protein
MDKCANEASFLRQLLEMARAVRPPSPPSGDLKPWMIGLGDFHRACMDDGRLSPTIDRLIPLNEKGEVDRQLNVIKLTSRQYSGQFSEITGALDYLIGRLKQGDSNEVSPRFSLEILPKLIGGLTQVQKNLFDSIWNHLVDTNTPLPARSLPPLLQGSKLEEAFQGLNGSFIREVEIDGLARAFTLTVQGALLTGHSLSTQDLLLRFWQAVQSIYDSDIQVKEISRDAIVDAMRLNKRDATCMFTILRLQGFLSPPVYMKTYNPDGSSWTLEVNDSITNLYGAEIKGYVNELLSEGYQPDEPIILRERRQWMNKSSEAFPFAVARPTASNLNIEFIDGELLQQVAEIRSSRYDCTRLVSMCRELNSSYAHGNVHAVAMLVRAILDHVPPIFGCEKFSQVAAQVSGKSLKHSFERLDVQSRKVADKLLHSHIRDREMAPTLTEVAFNSELAQLLSEVCRLLKPVSQNTNSG